MKDDRGETLLETLMAIMLLGIVVTAVMGAAMVGVRTSKLHDNQSSSAKDLRNWAESVSVVSVTNPYVDCAAASDFSEPTLRHKVLSVKYWDGDSFEATLPSCPVADQGIQQVALQVTTPGANNVSFSQQLEVVVRRP